MKKVMIGILLLCLLLGFQTGFAEETGLCGTNLKYTKDYENGSIDFTKADPDVEGDPVWGANCGYVFKDDPEIRFVTVSDPISVTEGYQLFKDFQS